MRIPFRILVLAAGMLAITTLQAASTGKTAIRRISAQDAQLMERTAGALATQSVASMWIWADKYVYQPGEQLTLRWTSKPNADLFPVTIVAYRQNNQSAAKFYVPGGGESVTDIFGRSMSEGFDIIQIPAAEKGVLLGAGGLLGGAVTIPNELGMHTIVVEFRDYTGNTVLKRSYFKISVVDEVITVSEPITSDTTWINTKHYRLAGTIFVENSAVLTIEPGTIIIGEPGSQPPSALITTRGSKLMAEGTKSRPIIFTSSLPFGQRRPGDWGGMAISGFAPTNEAGGEGTVEGLPAGERSRFGGDDPEWDCGSMKYVRIEFAGAELSQDREINAIGWASCGSATRADYIQAHYGSDDAFEWFGGTMDASHLVSTGGQDDGFDIQLGYTGKVQFFVNFFYDDSPGDHGIEADSNESDNSATPFTNATLYNATFVTAQTECVSGGCDGFRARRGLKGTYNNVIFVGFSSDTIDFRDSVTTTNIQNGEFTMNGVLAWNNNRNNNGANTIEGQFPQELARQFATGAVGQGENFVVADPMFRSLEQSDWDLRPAPGSPIQSAVWELPPADTGLDQTARHLGAFDTVDWTEEWTMKLRETDLGQ